MNKILKEIQKDNSPKKDSNNINKLHTIKSNNQNYRKIKLISKNNLPELKLSKIKYRNESETFNIKSINYSNASCTNNITNMSDIQNKKLSVLNISKFSSNMNKNDLIFPRIFNPIKNFLYKQEKNNNDSFNLLDVQNSNCNSNSNENRSIDNNMRNHRRLFMDKIQNTKKKEIFKKNLSEIHRIQKPNNYSFSQKYKKTNKQTNDKFKLHFLLKPISNKKNHLQIPLLNNSSSTNNINSEKTINIPKNIINNNNNKQKLVQTNTNHNININLNKNLNIKSFYIKQLKQSTSAKNVNSQNEFNDPDYITDRNNKNLNMQINKFSPKSSSNLLNQSPNQPSNNIFNLISKSISIPQDILYKSFLNFEESITSYYSEFSPPIKSIIKGYAYNTNKGNVRNYNEDTICVQKINSKIEQIFYFFGIFDGHGGKGCSSYLKNNLYKYIKEFSQSSLEDAIYKAENEFLNNYALDKEENVKDVSGSCGIMAIIKQNKLIIANIGDSRILLFKNGKLFFETEDHKPNSEKEKERIINSGGQIYQSTPLFQINHKIHLPWRVLPGRLSVSRTFGDLLAKSEKFGGKSGVIIPSPDVTEFDLDENFDFMVIGCDGIFDVISNEQIYEIWKIILNEDRYKDFEYEEIDINGLCGDFADAIIKSSLFKNSYDNLSCIVIVFNINRYGNDIN